MKAVSRVIAVALALIVNPALAQEYFGDMRPDAPELAARGPAAVGVRTLGAEHRDQLDVLRVTEQTPDPRTTRQLTLEVWYPAALANGQAEHTVYTDVLGSGPNDPKRPNTRFQFNGRAARDEIGRASCRERVF